METRTGSWRDSARLVDAATAARYRSRGWWSDLTLADHVRKHAQERPVEPAFTSPHGRLSWGEYETESNQLAQLLVGLGFGVDDRVAVRLPDGPSYHVAQLACEKAGLVTVGLPARAGDREVRHLLGKTAARALISHREHRGQLMSDLVAEITTIEHHIEVPEFERREQRPLLVDGAPAEIEDDPARLAGRGLGPDDLWLINSTSGTTGLPKCVLYHQNRQHYFSRLVIETGRLTAADVVMSIVPTPYGFGQWSSHFVPTYLGVHTVLVDRFDSSETLRLLERERVTMLCAVSTQFRMLLADPLCTQVDLSSLRLMFTGGEPVTYEAARRFEEVTGAVILNIYGSNEAGYVSGTTLEDGQERRLRTAGRVPDGTELRLYDEAGQPTTGRRGQPASYGPSIGYGYLDDEAANAELFTEDGFVRQADIVEIDDQGYVTVVGRKSDLIIRGGKNISAAEVEEEVSAHPRVALAAAVPIPDTMFGERVCVFVELSDREGPFELSDLTQFMLSRGVSKELLPERLEVLAELPHSAGGKVAKADLKRRAAEMAVAR